MNSEEHAIIEGRTLLLFDGLCGLCNGTIRFLIRRDPSRKLLYAPLESSLGQEMLELAAPWLSSAQPNDSGIVLIQAALTPAQVVSTRSNAAIRSLGLLRGAWPVAGHLLAAIPYSLRESAYGWVARWRYRMFGAYQSCPLPSAAERGLILGAGN